MAAPSIMKEQIKESGENMSEVERLTARVHDLSSLISAWNDAYMVLVALTVLLAVGVFIAQFVAGQKGKLLAIAQDALMAEKDRLVGIDSKEKDGRIADALKTAGDSNKAAGLANERASKAGENAAKARESLGEANKRASEADAKAESFRLDIAKANESAQQAEARTAEASLELERFKTPRNLSVEQQANISAALLRFAGTPYDLWVSTDNDSTSLMQQIDAALRGAKWEFSLQGIIQFGGKAGIISGTGVEIHVSEEDIEKLGPAAFALANVLNSAGIPQRNVFQDGSGTKDMVKGRIHVRIGSKPLE